jgi:hypothetical protein
VRRDRAPRRSPSAPSQKSEASGVSDTPCAVTHWPARDICHASTPTATGAGLDSTLIAHVPEVRGADINSGAASWKRGHTSPPSPAFCGRLRSTHQATDSPELETSLFHPESSAENSIWSYGLKPSEPGDCRGDHSDHVESRTQGGAPAVAMRSRRKPDTPPRGWTARPEETTASLGRHSEIFWCVDTGLPSNSSETPASILLCSSNTPPSKYVPRYVRNSDGLPEGRIGCNIVWFCRQRQLPRLRSKQSEKG